MDRNDNDVRIKPIKTRTSIKIDSVIMDWNKSLGDFKQSERGKNDRGLTSLIELGRNWGYGLWIRYSAYTLLAIAIQLIVGTGSWAFPDKDLGCGEVKGSLFANEDDQNKAICLLEGTLDSGSTTLRILTSFILGGFLVGAVNLWLAKRTAYCALCGATRNMLINLCSIIPADQDKRLFARWVVLGYELSVLKGRGLIDSDIGKAYLERLDLLEGDEWDNMVDGDRHTTVWFWVQVKAAELLEKGEIDGLKFQTICQAVTLSRDKANDLMSGISRDQPPPYSFVCGLCVSIHLLLLSLSAGFKWAVWMHSTQGAIWSEPRMYADILLLYVNTSMYAMLFDLSVKLYNPFGPRNTDIMHHEVGRGIRRLAKSLSKNVYPSSMYSNERMSERQHDMFIDQESNRENEAMLDNEISQLVSQAKTNRSKRNAFMVGQAVSKFKKIKSVPAVNDNNDLGMHYESDLGNESC